MVKVDSFKEVIEYLKDTVVLTTDGKNQIYLDHDKVRIVSKGSSFPLSLEDFYSLYCHNNFYLIEDEITVDEQKDEDYYRYYKK